MSWTDPCARCDSHRADCDCKEGYASTTSVALKQEENYQNKNK